MPANKINNPQELGEYLEKLYKKALWRNVGVRAKDHPLNDSGSKQYDFERPTYKSEDIKKNRGYPCSRKKKADGYESAISICLKETPDCFLVDFDSKDKCNDENPMFRELMEMDTYRTETAKGWHFYIRIKNMPNGAKFANAVKVVKPEYEAECGDVDLIGRKVDNSLNSVELADRVVGGDNLAEVEWDGEDDYGRWFDWDKMITGNIGKKNHCHKKRTEKKLAEAGFGAKKHIGEKHIQEYLGRLKPNRFSYDCWLKCGIIIKNSIKDEDNALAIWWKWTRSDPVYDKDNSEGGHNHRNKKYVEEKWETFGDGDLSWHTLRCWAYKDDPRNEFQELYDVGGEDAVVRYMNEFLCQNRSTAEFIYIDPLDNSGRRVPTIQTKTGLTQIYQNKSIDTGGKQKDNPIKMWLNNINQRQCARMVFDPRPCAQDMNVFNLYQGFRITPESVADLPLAEAQTGCQGLTDHIFNIWCKKEKVHYDYIMNWFAHIMQKPWIKMGVIVAIKSNQGGGKGIVFQFIHAILGHQLFRNIDNIQDILGDNANAELEGRLFINLDEAQWGGDSKSACKLKSVITNTEITIKNKYEKARTTQSYVNFTTATNNNWGTSAEMGDRRHYCLELCNCMAGITNTEEKKLYWHNISGKWSESDGIDDYNAECFLKVLLSRDLSAWDYKNIPQTQYLNEQIDKNLDPVPKWWLGVLQSGRFSINNPLDFIRKRKCVGFDDCSINSVRVRNAMTYGYIHKNLCNGEHKIKKVMVAMDKPTDFYALMPAVAYKSDLFPDMIKDGFMFPQWWDASHGKCEINEDGWWGSGARAHNWYQSFVNPIWEAWIKTIISIQEQLRLTTISPDLVKDKDNQYSEAEWHKFMLPVPVWFWKEHINLLSSYTSIPEDKQFVVKYGDGGLINQPAFINSPDGDRCIRKSKMIHCPAWQKSVRWVDMDWIKEKGFIRSPHQMSRLLIDCPEFCVDGSLTDESAFKQYMATYNYSSVKSKQKNPDHTLFSANLLVSPEQFLTSTHIVEEVRHHHYYREWFFDAFIHSIGNGYGATKVDARSFWKEMEDMLGADFDGNKRISRGGVRQYCLRAVDLSVARKRMAEYLRRPNMDWGDDVDGSDSDSDGYDSD